MADEFQETSGQGDQIADKSVPNNQEDTLAADDITQHNEDNVAQPVDNPAGGSETESYPSGKVIDPAADTTDEVAGTAAAAEQAVDPCDQDQDHGQAIPEQTDSLDNQDPSSSDLPDQDSNHVEPHQDLCDTPPSQELLDGSPTSVLAIPDSEDSPANQNNALPVNDPSEVDVSQVNNDQHYEQGEANATLPPTKPNQPVESFPPVNEGMEKEETPSKEEQNQIQNNEDFTQDNVQMNDDHSKDGQNQTIESVPGDAPEDEASPQQPPVHKSPSSNQDNQTAEDSNPVSPQQFNDNINQGQQGEAESINSPSSPQPPFQMSPSPPTRKDSTPGSLQHNNNNELHRGGDEFDKFGSVHIPTAGVGDIDETDRGGGSHDDLKDPAMYKMRSSLPVDAYGDSRSHHLPAIHRDPRLSRSLPVSTDPDNIPEGYYNRSVSLGDAKRSRQHIPRIPSANGSIKVGTRDGDVRRALNSAKLPPSVVKMSTVMVSARKRAVLNRQSSVFYEERHQTKVISLDEAINSRPPMPFDLDNPGPWSYSPRNKPLNETNAPEFTFGHRLQEKNGGGRTANAKTWFNSKDGFTTKVHWDKRWPSPAHYNSTRPLLGRRKPTMFDYPNFSIGAKSQFTINKRGSENEPAPNEYNRSKSDAVILRRAPSYTISERHQGTQLWGGKEFTPGPGTYNPRWGFNSGTVHHPSFTIQGVRRTKNHQLGPHSTF